MAKRYTVGTQFRDGYGDVSEITAIGSGKVTLKQISISEVTQFARENDLLTVKGDANGIWSIDDSDENWGAFNEAVDSGDWMILAGGPQEVA